jgi:subtilase family serine protease
MTFRPAAAAWALMALLAFGASPALAGTHRAHHVRSAVIPLAFEAPDAPGTTPTGTPPACVTPSAPDAGNTTFRYSVYHCNTPADITANYGVDSLHTGGTMGQGQTIVLVDSYGSPTAAHDLQVFHDTFYSGLDQPNFDQVCQPGCKDYSNVGNGQSGSGGASGWAGEANLDVQWAYAIAPLAHIVLLGVPPAETEGVQGFPNLFKAISDAIDRYPSGTVFSMSFGVTEETFTGSSAKSQLATFDGVFKKGLAKGDTFVASSGDDGSAGVSKMHRDTVYYGHPVVGWPASSPYVTAVGGTQLMRGWKWNPQSDQPFNADGTRNNPYFAWDDTPGQTFEPAWNESWLPAATGGGDSIIYSKPSWQNVTVTTTAGAPVNHRGVPDVAWDAAVNGGVLVYTTFYPQVSRVGWHVFGGTSASSPQFAGVVALANQVRAAQGDSPIGYLNPVLYGQVDASTAFRDVVAQSFGITPSGNIVDNGLWGEVDGQGVTPPAVPGHAVTSGWDETTGFGVPNSTDLVSQLAAATPVPAP